MATPCPACGGSCRPLRPPPRPRGRLILVLATLLLLALWATAAHATPLHFGFGSGERPAFFLCTADPSRWTGPIAPIPGGCINLPLNMLGVAAWITPFPQPTESAMFHFDATRYGGSEVLLTADLLVPPPFLASQEFTTLGLVFTFLVPDDTYAVQDVRLHFTLPDDEQTLDYAYQQPVPEPATIFLLGSGMVWLGWRGRRRR